MLLSDDGYFIAHSRVDVVRLLDHIRILTAENTYHATQLDRCAAELRRVRESAMIMRNCSIWAHKGYLPELAQFDKLIDGEV